MNRTALAIPLFGILLLLCGALAEAQSEGAASAPAWLLMAQGKNEFQEGNFGRALELFRASIAAGGDTPEAEMWIGKVFEVEGETQLAVDQYNRALALRKQFLIPADAVAVEYSLANLYANTGQYGKYEVTLRSILKLDSYYSDPSRASMRDAMLRILRDGGLDRIMTLYRFQDQQALKAHSDLGVFAYRTGRYADSTLNLTFALITILTTAIDALEQENPDYHFTGVTDLVEHARAVARIDAYFSHAELFRDLYYLGAALYADGEAARARSVWRIPSELGSTGDPWRQRAAVQLRKPYIEPILDLGE